MIDRYKSGFVPPEDFQFETASGPDTTDAPAKHHPYNHLTAARGTVSGKKEKKRTGLLSIFSSNKVGAVCEKVYVSCVRSELVHVT